MNQLKNEMPLSILLPKTAKKRDTSMKNPMTIKPSGLSTALPI